MQAIDTGRLVDGWERGQSQHPLHRALTLLQCWAPEQTIDALAALSIGERDRRLIRLRQRLFGSRFDAVAQCPRCGEKLELEFGAEQLPQDAGAESAFEVQVDGRGMAVRLPTSADLLEVAHVPAARRIPALLERCAGAGLTESEAEAVENKMAEMDPASRIELELICPACEHRWRDLFDIASYFWTELSDLVVRVLRETHLLARAYGWREADIFALSPRRRQVYLDLVLGA